MTEHDHKSYLIAKARLDTLNIRRKDETLEERKQLEAVLAQIGSLRPLRPQEMQRPQRLQFDKPKAEPIQRGFVAYLPQNDLLSPEIAAMVDEMKQEAATIDFQKNTLADALFDIPDNVNCKAQVQEIKRLREVLLSKMDEIRFVQQHGHRPEKIAEASVFDAEKYKEDLPKTALELDQKIRNRRTDLSKYKKRLQAAKTDMEKYKQEKNIVKAENELITMQTQFKLLTND